MIALVEAHRAGLFARNHWLPNVVAGVIVGVVALPLAMTFAIHRGVHVLFCEANERVLGKLRKAMVIPDGPSDRYVERFGEALQVAEIAQPEFLKPLPTTREARALFGDIGGGGGNR